MTKPAFWYIWLTAIRPKTLWAAFAPVLIGVAMAIEASAFHPTAAVLTLLGALFIQIGTNFYNDFADYEKGADTVDRKGPTRVTLAGWVSPGAMKWATFLVFGLAVLSGLYLMSRGGWPIIVIGVLSILSGILYTAGKYSLAYMGLGDLFVLVFFGPVAVGGTYFVQVLDITLVVLISGLAPGLLAVAILLINNIRDEHEDARAGKKTLVARFGRTWGIVMYIICMTGAICIPIALFALHPEKPAVLITCMVLIPAVINVYKLWRTPAGPALNPLLGSTARLLLLYSVLFSLSWNI